MGEAGESVGYGCFAVVYCYIINSTIESPCLRNSNGFSLTTADQATIGPRWLMHRSRDSLVNDSRQPKHSLAPGTLARKCCGVVTPPRMHAATRVLLHTRAMFFTY